jgi:MYXO-CTERM domain-containing protein
MVARKIRAVLAGVAASAWASASWAQVVQTDAAQTPLPQPVGPNEVNLATNSWAYNRMTQVNHDLMGTEVSNQNKHFGDYYPAFEDGDAITLSGLFKFRGEQIDPVADARTSPGYFSPSCGFAGQLVLRGGDCEVSFGWYNVDDPNSTTAPSADEIYPFMPLEGSTITADLACQPPLQNGFCPLAWDNVDPRNLDKKLWQPRAYDSGSIKQDPRYKGKYVGFAVLGNPNKLCTQTKYSMLEHNQRNAAGKAWVTTLIYQSTVDPEGFYMAFEDLPMSPDDWHKTGVNGNNATNDGDFNDFVFYVSGISCLGGGEPCDSGLKGACSVGRTDCASDGMKGMCRPIIAPGVEACDNVDNDCNGEVDDGEGLCPGNQVCDKGTCVGACGTGEFRCAAGETCKAGFCIDTACADVSCEPGQACRDGACVDACAGVVCPTGQECQLGRCVDPCAAVECAAGKVCERGLCVSDCTCRGCLDGLTCGTDGRCVDEACVGVDCGQGMKCVAGQCTDPCEGVTCPGGGACVEGACQMGTGGSGATGGTGNVDVGVIDLGGKTSSSSTGGTRTRGPAKLKDPGCACEVAGGSSGRPENLAYLLGSLGLGMAFASRCRRFRRW